MTPTRANRSAVKSGPPPGPASSRPRWERWAPLRCSSVIVIRGRLPGVAALGTGGRGFDAGGPVILVVIDTLRADRLPVYGYPAGRAPALTAFAREAVVFDRAYAHAPQTLPVARVDVHRPAAVRAQGSRQPGVHAGARARLLWPRCFARRDTRPGDSFRRTCCGRRPASRRGSTSTTRRFRRWPRIGRSPRSSGQARKRLPPPRRGSAR